jgi:ABC-type nitrate/sulfonate/bicarbonate transport system substrate-binding protein
VAWAEDVDAVPEDDEAQNRMSRRTFLGRAGLAGAFAAAAPVGVWAQAFTSPAAERSSVVDPVPESTRLVLGFGDDPVFAPHMVAIEKRFLRSAGFIEIVTRTFSDEALAAETLAAGGLSLWTVGNSLAISTAHSGVPIVVLGTNAITAKQAPHSRSLFVATQEFVRRCPIATRQMVAGMLRAQRHVADPKNREEVVDLVCHETGRDKAAVSALWDGYVFDPALDEGYVEDMKAMTDSLAAGGSIKSPKDPLDYTFSKPLAAADASLVKVAGRFDA